MDAKHQVLGFMLVFFGVWVKEIYIYIYIIMYVYIIIYIYIYTRFPEHHFWYLCQNLEV